MWLRIHAGIKVKNVSKRGPGTSIALLMKTVAHTYKVQKQNVIKHLIYDAHTFLMLKFQKYTPNVEE